MARLKEFDPNEKLRKAKNLFWKKGYQATSIQDLVDDMKINRGSLYDTYGDKHKLFIDSIQSYVLETHTEYKAAIAGESAPMKAIERIINLAIKRSFEEGKVCLVVKSSFEMAQHDKDIKIALQKSTDALMDIFEGLLQKAQDQGAFEGSRNVRETAHFIVASFAGFWQMQELYSNRKMVEQLGKCLLAFLE